MDTKLNMKTIFALAILIVVAFTPLSVHACTAFMMSDGERVLAGNNEDYNIPHTRVWFVPAENGHYGRVYFGYENWSPQGGMTDQGVFFDFFLTKPLEAQISGSNYRYNGGGVCHCWRGARHVRSVQSRIHVKISDVRCG